MIKIKSLIVKQLIVNKAVYLINLNSNLEN